MARLLTKGPPVLTSVWVQADLSRRLASQVLWTVEGSLRGYKELIELIAHFEAPLLGVGRGIGDSLVVVSGVSGGSARPQ